MKAILALEDGRCFEGISFGATGTTTGEICFNTSMSGYQEVITDPSYRGQIVAMTYPQIGNYGINPEDAESNGPHIRAFVIGELCEVPSNWRSNQTLSAYLAEHGILGIEDIDTRALTKHLRTLGALRACVTTELDAEAAVAAAQAAPPMAGSDFVKEVSTPTSYRWEAESREWVLPNASTGATGPYAELPPVRHRIVAYDFGLKHNILRRLRQTGFDVEVVSSSTTAEEVMAMNPDGIFLSNGPGDPAALDYIYLELRKLIGQKPIFGICLGNQLLAHAFGGSTFKLKFGHRGGNQPVKDLRSGKISITSQNHGFAVDAATLPDDVEVTHINLNDGTVEGMRHKIHPVFSVQYHPEAAPGPNDASYFFEEFAALIDQSKQ
ncbi:glutamine-hydrolyzing carbamoyl-phosphate synthase small subunit [Luteolibacter pohnpeiensis]|uniref:Carbamoyl phosphate synthase small chain n=1 Tax=Luteolibacter pohnpeiensis TaxID=454153 RepID=A0A934SFU4_9BACT|nr:glutamine-hydrolyzing carbamoyl-phosphate synthase small subunit [Luteolibacter pohnpeiensis]